MIVHRVFPPISSPIPYCWSMLTTEYKEFLGLFTYTPNEAFLIANVAGSLSYVNFGLENFIH